VPRERQIRIRGVQRENIDVDLLAQIVIMLGRQLAQEAASATGVHKAKRDAASSDGGDV
jgi:hypothetical protein